eukprot:CAMPEP_0115636750 /NCGR_PEP_ID=MMETSP0272-20121206/33833_1 /TAXON_ID=71861 /ORGANISM="Scrippsiella trochoidea, Strain CCMP3099" /LENGTH=42 /DNA_ID= /DNA_START= /DNA_END= /DNA_ORIENTATION=
MKAAPARLGGQGPRQKAIWAVVAAGSGQLGSKARWDSLLSDA